MLTIKCKKMRSVRILLIINLFLLVGNETSLGKDFPDPENPDHLEPISPYDPFDYNPIVFRSLLGINEIPVLWMVSKPSFSTEYAIKLTHSMVYEKCKKNGGNGKDTSESDPFDRGKLIEDKWLLESCVAKGQIWKELEKSEYQINSDRRSFKVSCSQKIEISSEVAIKMRAVWLVLLKETKYRKYQVKANDGITYMFGCDGYAGQTNTPSRGMPLELVNLSHKLIGVTKSVEGDRGRKIQECVIMAEKLLERNGARR